jgi:hypothetical protein
MSDVAKRLPWSPPKSTSGSYVNGEYREVAVVRPEPKLRKLPLLPAANIYEVLRQMGEKRRKDENSS